MQGRQLGISIKDALDTSFLYNENLRLAPAPEAYGTDTHLQNLTFGMRILLSPRQLPSSIISAQVGVHSVAWLYALQLRHQYGVTQTPYSRRLETVVSHDCADSEPVSQRKSAMSFEVYHQLTCCLRNLHSE